MRKNRIADFGMLERHPSLLILSVYFLSINTLGALLLTSMLFLGIDGSLMRELDYLFALKVSILLSLGFLTLSGYLIIYTITFILFTKNLNIKCRILTATGVYIVCSAIFYIFVGSTLTYLDVLKFSLGWICVAVAELLTSAICKNGFGVLQNPR